MSNHETLHIRFDTETVAKLDRIADHENRTRNNVVNTLVKKAITHWYENEGQSPEFETVNQLSKGVAR